MSEAEFTDFVAHRSPALLRTAYLLCGGDKGAAEDLLQEVLERVFPRWRRIREHPEPYVRAALANAATNRWRHKARRVAEAPLDWDMPHPHLVGPEQGIANRDLVVKALGALPPKMRAVIVLRFFDDLSEADTAGGHELRRRHREEPDLPGPHPSARADRRRHNRGPAPHQPEHLMDTNELTHALREATDDVRPRQNFAADVLRGAPSPALPQPVHHRRGRGRHGRRGRRRGDRATEPPGRPATGRPARGVTSLMDRAGE